MNAIDYTKPEFYSIENTKAVVEATTITYNESNVQYSSSSQTYGGSDRKQSVEPNLLDTYQQLNIKPRFYDN